MDLTIPRVLMWQFLTGMVLAAVLWVVFDKVAGYSAMLGSLICLIPNAFLALRLSVPRRSPGAAALMQCSLGRRNRKAGAHRTVLQSCVYAGQAALGSGAFCRIHCDATRNPVRVLDA